MATCSSLGNQSKHIPPTFQFGCLAKTDQVSPSHCSGTNQPFVTEDIPYQWKFFPYTVGDQLKAWFRSQFNSAEKKAWMFFLFAPKITWAIALSKQNSNISRFSLSSCSFHKRIQTAPYWPQLIKHYPHNSSWLKITHDDLGWHNPIEESNENQSIQIKFLYRPRCIFDGVTRHHYLVSKAGFTSQFALFVPLPNLSTVHFPIRSQL